MGMNLSQSNLNVLDLIKNEQEIVNLKEVKLPDGKGILGRGRFTDKVM